MKTLLSVLLGFCITALAYAQPSAEIGVPKRTPEELEKLLAPIALYPDALIALILPASANSSDIVLAARYLSANPSPTDLDSQPWEESVKSLSRYPEVVKWMDENLTWTREVGEAFAAQPADVMNTIQKLRSDARANGLLKDTPQQKVVMRDAEVCIVPAEENVIYVPSYDPEVLIERRPYYDSWLTFSVGFATGSWLYYDCDWGSRSVWIYRRPSNWAYRPDWRWHERDRVRVVHEQWRPSPTYWHHVQQSRSYASRPIPRVEPPRFPSHENGFDANRRWDGRRDEHGYNAQHVPPTRPSADRERTWDLRQQQHSTSGYSVGDRRIHQGNTVVQTPLAPVGAVAPVAAVAPQTAPAVNAIPTAPAARPAPDRHRRPEGVAGERHFPREINNPPAQRTDIPSAVRQQPPAPPSPERIGQAGPHAGQYTTRPPDRPIGNYRREAASPAPSVAPPPAVQHSAPVAVSPPAPAPVHVAPASAPAPTSDPGRDQRGGYRNRNDDDGRNKH